MPYEFLGHTADARMRVTGEVLEALFTEALAGLTALAQPQYKNEGRPTSLTVGEERVRAREVNIEAPDVTALLVDFLNHALYLMHEHREAYESVEFEELTETRARAKLFGKPVDSFGEDIKAVTYHEANVRRGERGEWETNIVFDI